MGDRAGRAARPDRPARRRLRPRLRVDGRRRRAARARPLPDAAAGPQPGRAPSSRSPASPTCCSGTPASTLEFDGQRAAPARHPARLLGRRQPVPPPPGPRPAAAGLAAAGTIIVHEPYWTATARHADIVFPATTSLERDDIGGRRATATLIAMHQARRAGRRGPRRLRRSSPGSPSALGAATASPRAAPRTSGCGTSTTSRRAAARGAASTCPTFDEFWADGEAAHAGRVRAPHAVRGFPRRPRARPLRTPSGRIELFSETIDGFGYDDCPGHPAWMEPASGWARRGAERFPLHLVANQPATRLHSQLDVGAHSRGRQGRRPRADADPSRRRRGARHRRRRRGARVQRPRRVPGRRGASATPSAPSVVQLSTGAWYDPLDPATPTVRRTATPTC